MQEMLENYVFYHAFVPPGGNGVCTFLSEHSAVE